MNPLAAALLLLGLVDKALALRLAQYAVNPGLVEADAENAEELARLGTAVLKAIAKVGDAIDDGFEDLFDLDLGGLTTATLPATPKQKRKVTRKKAGS